MPKYWITEGCIAYNRTIDEKSIDEGNFTSDELYDHIEKLLPRANKSTLLDIIEDLLGMNEYDDLRATLSILVKNDKKTKYKMSDEPCECCSDYIEDWILDI